MYEQSDVIQESEVRKFTDHFEHPYCYRSPSPTAWAPYVNSALGSDLGSVVPLLCVVVMKFTFLQEEQLKEATFVWMFCEPPTARTGIPNIVILQ